MDLTYAVADLHGSFDLLEAAVLQIETHAGRRSRGSRTIVFLGDYIDRGSQSREVIEGLMGGQATMGSAGWQWVCLMGNHEDMMIATYDRRFDPDWWCSNGGFATLASYGSRNLDEPNLSVIPEAHIAWARVRPLMHTDLHRVFVHAGVDPTVSLDRQTEETLLWSRESCTLGHGGRFVVHGHTPNPRGPVGGTRFINLDTLAWKTGRLVVAVFDDERPGGPVELIEILRASLAAHADGRGWQ